MSMPNRDKGHQRHCLTTNHICATTSSRRLPFPPGKPRVTRPLRISTLIHPPAPTPAPRCHAGDAQRATPCRRRTTCDTRPRHHTRDARPRDATLRTPARDATPETCDAARDTGPRHRPATPRRGRPARGASPARHTGDTRFRRPSPNSSPTSHKCHVRRSISRQRK
jgi:hypothetical protein